MHLIVATQRPSVDVVTGLIKANIPTRVAFAVSSQVDSKTIIDIGGAEKLMGKGDMLFYPTGAIKPERIQGCFVSDNEVEKVVQFLKSDHRNEYDEDVINEIERQAAKEKAAKSGLPEDAVQDDADPMLDDAIMCVVELGQASTSLLQRKLRLGYARAARLIDMMEERGVVGPYEGSKPRQVLITKEQLLEQRAGSSDSE
ncbi:MAG: DNA translocase FtsK, partial [Clostridia bacterium]|nr:DNA translocase FtsK [Clostridia bacterium]